MIYLIMRDVKLFIIIIFIQSYTPIFVDIESIVKQTKSW